MPGDATGTGDDVCHTGFEPPAGSLSLYFHWPFCAAKCPYCDFNSHVRSRIDEAAWEAALLSELDRITTDYQGAPLVSIFFGGGTPSLMPPRIAAALIDRATSRLRPLPDLEITLEANPTSADVARFSGFRAAGVNRLSVGVQSLDDAALKFLGRWHSAREALDAVALAARHFNRLSFDLIYALPEQSVQAWEAELSQALNFAPEHLSLYQLTIEEGTAFASRHRRGEFTIPDQDMSADLFHLTQEVTNAAGLPAYEISNHAAVGRECRHNLMYWSGGAYAGIGPGAHGRLHKDGFWSAQEQTAHPESWLKAAISEGNADTITPLTAPERAEEMLMMGFRLSAGVSERMISQLTGLKAVDLPIDRKELSYLKEKNLVAEAGRRLRLTATGRPLLNSILTRLIPA